MASVAFGALPPPPVVGGQPAPDGAWPDAGALYMGDLYACTSVLIEPDLLLTAAHCFGSPYWTNKRVLLDTLDHATDDGVWVDIEEGFVHPDSFNTFDLAVFVLAEPAPVAPRPLMLDCLVDYLVEGATVSIVGFGALDTLGRETTTILHQAQTTVVEPSCDSVNAGCNRDVAPFGELIAGGGGIDSCTGDSGGPLYLSTPQGTVVAGITSRAALPTDTPCGNGGIYLRADAVADWIEEVTGRTLTRPACDGVNRVPQPFAAPLVVPLGGTGETWIEPRDPNVDDTHTFELVRGADVGNVTVAEDGHLVYDSWRVALIAPDLVVRVTDSEGASADLTVPVELVIPEGGEELDPRCGCASSAAGSGAWLALGLVGVGIVRRRRRHGLHRRGVETRSGGTWPHPPVRRA